MAENTLLQLIEDATARLAPVSDSARLDVELLLAHALGKSRAWLRAHADERIADAAAFDTLLARRAAGEPVAYLLGSREFWSLPLAVRPGVLIPRPDTETLVHAALESVEGRVGLVIADLGTGSGAVALALAKELPESRIVATDASAEAVALARENAVALGLADQIDFLTTVKRDWFTELGDQRFDLIVSNPPYVAEGDPHLERGDVRFEPRAALVSGSDGLDDIRVIVADAPDHLITGGWLLLEHGHEQADAVAVLLQDHGFEDVRRWRDLAGHQRVTGARHP